MIPTLQVGDLIIVQGVPNASNVEVDLKDAPEPGDIIVFYNPHKGYKDPNDLIVHRAINKTSKEGKLYFKTQGDANSCPDNWDVPEDFVVGKVVFFRIPLVGFITFLMRTPAAILVVLPPLILLVIDWIPFSKERDELKERDESYVRAHMPQMIVCKYCSARNKADQTRCVNCGALLT